MSKEYFYNIGDIINGNEIVELAILKRGTWNVKAYILKCVSCGHINDKKITETKVKSGKGCPVCSGHKVVSGINDIATTHPEICKYLKNINDSKKYSRGSNVKIEMVCPDCGNIKLLSISTFLRQGMGCVCNKNGKSYPEKFVISLLNNSNISFSSEKIFDWAKNKRYDFFVESLSLIIETHGKQHYTDSFSYNNSKSLKEEQENDKLKQELAMKNNIKHYIVLDCRISELKVIKNSIMNSDLPNLLNFKERDIDWLKCVEYAESNSLIDVCELWNSGICDITKISNIIKLHKITIINFLKKGEIMGICNYCHKIESCNRSKLAIDKMSKKIIVFTNNWIEVGTFNSTRELERMSMSVFGTKLLSSGTSCACRNNTPYKNMRFKYQE